MSKIGLHPAVPIGSILSETFIIRLGEYFGRVANPEWQPWQSAILKGSDHYKA